MLSNIVLLFYFVIFGILPKESNLMEINPVDKNILLGKFDASKHKDFIRINSPFALQSNMYLQKEVLDAFILMHDAAKLDGVNLQILSATRSFNRQKTIWENKWKGISAVNGKNLAVSIPDFEKRAIEILRFSSMPGTSRHHWGTDIDINSLSPSYFKSGRGLKEYTWLVENAHKFGFAQPYKDKGNSRIFGYEDEPWHWSYLPLACKFYKAYSELVTYEDVKGFHGDVVAEKIDVISKYVLSVYEDCKCLD